MKKIKILLIAVAVFFVGLVVVEEFALEKGKKIKESMNEPQITEEGLAAYRKSLESLKTIKFEEMKKKVEAKESFLVYIGAERCPYCVKFLPKLEEANKELKKEIFHVDAKSDEGLSKFFEENKLSTIPALLKIKDGAVINLEVHSSNEVNQLAEKLKQN